MNKVHISKHSGKMDQFDSISTSSLLNPFCLKMNCNKNLICNKCYGIRLEMFRPTMTNKLQENNLLLSGKPLTKEQIPKINRLYFRFNSFAVYGNPCIIIMHLFNKCKIYLLTNRVIFKSVF